MFEVPAKRHGVQIRIEREEHYERANQTETTGGRQRILVERRPLCKKDTGPLGCNGGACRLHILYAEQTAGGNLGIGMNLTGFLSAMIIGNAFWAFTAAF